MNKKRCFAPVCLLLFVALILTGCGGETFDKTAEDGDIAARIEKNVAAYLATRK